MDSISELKQTPRGNGGDKVSTPSEVKNSAVANKRTVVLVFPISLLWIIVSLFITNYLWVSPWSFPVFAWIDALADAILGVASFTPSWLPNVFGMDIVRTPGFIGALLMIPAALVFPVVFSKRFAKLMLFVLPLISFFAAVLIFPTLGVPCEGLNTNCLQKPLSMSIEMLTIFVAIAVLPTAWTRQQLESLAFKRLLTKSLLPGLIIGLSFSILWIISTYPFYKEQERELRGRMRIDAEESLGSKSYSFIANNCLGTLSHAGSIALC